MVLLRTLGICRAISYKELWQRRPYVSNIGFRKIAHVRLYQNGLQRWLQSYHDQCRSTWILASRDLTGVNAEKSDRTALIEGEIRCVASKEHFSGTCLRGNFVQTTKDAQLHRIAAILQLILLMCLHSAQADDQRHRRSTRPEILCCTTAILSNPIIAVPW